VKNTWLRLWLTANANGTRFLTCLRLVGLAAMEAGLQVPTVIHEAYAANATTKNVATQPRREGIDFEILTVIHML